MNTQDKKTENLKANLMNQVDKIMGHTNEKSIKTRYRYYDAVERFCGFLAKEYRLQKFQNVKEKHFIRYSEYLKEQGYSSSYIKTDLAGIRFFSERSGSKNVLPDNTKLDLDKRQIGQLDRAWTKSEISSAIIVANNMGRPDISLAIKMAGTFGMRLEEVCKCQANHIKSAIKNGELYIKGKNGQVRYLHIKTAQQRELLNEVSKFANANGRKGTDKVLVDSVKGAVLEEKRSIQNWVVNHRSKFQDDSRENIKGNKELEEKAIMAGVKLKTDTITFHGLRHHFAQERYQFYRDRGCSVAVARRSVSEELGHHREAVTKIYLADK